MHKLRFKQIQSPKQDGTEFVQGRRSLGLGKYVGNVLLARNGFEFKILLGQPILNEMKSDFYVLGSTRLHLIL